MPKPAVQTANSLGAVEDKVQSMEELIVEGLLVDGVHHKQWYIERIAEAVGMDLYRLRAKQEAVCGYSWDPGIAP
jgi:hypothetical protein